MPTSATPRITNTSASRATIGDVGITDHAQQQLGDVVFVELPTVGDEVRPRATQAAVVESVKAASDVFAPVSRRGRRGQRRRSKATPGLINEDAHGRGWLFKLKLADPAELDGLMDEAAYAEYLKTIA